MAISRELLLDYFLGGARPRTGWKIGMEVERLGRRATDGRPLPFDGDPTSIREVLELIRRRRGGQPVEENGALIGVDAPWGGLSLEPGGQVEWSSRPQATFSDLGDELDAHLAALGAVGAALGIRWLDVAVDPEWPVGEMIWIPKKRYRIMRSFLGERGELAHRMMTQTASIQCAFDYESASDWKRKFKAAATLAPVATALFANSSRVDGEDSGYRSYRQKIWRHTDPARCGLPPVVFEKRFDIEHWLDWILGVPTIFRRRAGGLEPAGGVPFRELLQSSGPDAIGLEDWETHASTIFTEVRSYTYIEIRSADLQPDIRALAVPSFWTGLMYQEQSLDAALALGAAFDSHASWVAGMESAGREGLEARIDGRRMRELAQEVLAVSAAGLRGGAACVDDPSRPLSALRRLAEHHGLVLSA